MGSTLSYGLRRSRRLAVTGTERWTDGTAFGLHFFIMRRMPVILAWALGAACSPAPAETGDQAALESIRPETIRAHMQFLADDLLEGRRTGERGYEIAARYVAAQMGEIGLEPAFGDSWFQRVPFRTADVTGASLTLTAGGTRRTLRDEKDFLIAPNPFEERAVVEAPVVFAGYGITAPEAGHDDYAGLDVEGKVVAVLSAAPSRFPNHLRAFHSQMREKNRNAAERGAVGMIVFSTPDEEKRVPWDLAVTYSRAPDFLWLDDDGEPVGVPRALRFRAKLSRSGAEALFAGSGRTLDDVFAEAASSGKPRGMRLDASVRVELSSRHGRVESPNVGGILRGSDPELGDEYFTYVAHLDHLGVAPRGEGDRINNGAYDNASGVAIMLEVAEAFAQLQQPPARSVLFLAVTGEEMGLLGAEYFVHHPPVPLDRIVANVSLDMFLMLYPLRDVIAFGAEHSTLGSVAERAAGELGIAISPDPMPEEVIFIRSDQFRFVQKGIPALFLVHGLDSGDPSRDGGTITARWRRERYHRPGDDMTQEMNFQAGVDFAKLNLLIGRHVANAEERPDWHAGDFFGEKFTAPR